MTIEFSLGVKYCGHCNPQSDGPALVSELQRLLPDMEVLPWDFTNANYKILLIISACPAHCVSIPNFSGTRIEIAANQIRSFR